MSVEIGPVDPSAAVRPGGAPSDANEQSEPAAADAAQREDAKLSGEEGAGEARLRALLERLGGGPNVHARLSIDRDEAAGAFVYRILDSRSGEVVRQFPQEQALELMRFLGEQRGLVVDRKV